MLDRTETTTIRRPAHWFVVTSAPRKEFEAMHWLKSGGIPHAYVPVARTIQRRARGRTAAVLEPMFRGYLFVGDPGDERRDMIPHMPCVQRVLETNGRWKTLSDTIVLGIFQQETDKHANTPAELKWLPRLKPGDFVRFTEGQFAGFTGRFEQLAGRDRIVVLFSLLGRDVRTTIDATQVVAA